MMSICLRWGWLRWLAPAALGCTTLLLGCGKEHDQVLIGDLAASGDNELELGHLHLPLVTPSADKVRLTAATFTIVNRSKSRSLSVSTDTNPSAESLDIDLPQDTYDVTLQDGWVLERTDVDAGVLQAALITDNPSTVVIENGQVKQLIYSFTTEAGVLTFGQGGLSLGVALTPAGTLGQCSLIDRSSCPAGKTCLLADQSGATFCAEPGTLPVGSLCASEQCVAGAQCLRLDAEHPDQGICSRFCNPASHFCGCQSLSFSADVGVCKDPDQGVSFRYTFPGAVSSPESCAAWNQFESELPNADFSHVAVRSESGAALECGDASRADQICSALSGSGASNLSVSCQGHTWSVSNCGGGNSLFVDTPACSCNYSTLSTVIRPCDGSWNGVQDPNCYYSYNQQAPRTLEVVCDHAAAPPGRCGDGVINQASEQCDGTAIPVGAPAGSVCNASCQLSQEGACGQCVQDTCVAQRAVVDADAAAQSVVACVLGDSWRAGDKAPAASCGNHDLLTCYCGSASGADCANANPSTLAGQCTSQILTGAGCTSSDCLAPIFVNPANATGKAMQYLQCQQDFCYDLCFSL